MSQDGQRVYEAIVIDLGFCADSTSAEVRSIPTDLMIDYRVEQHRRNPLDKIQAAVGWAVTEVLIRMRVVPEWPVD